MTDQANVVHYYGLAIVEDHHVSACGHKRPCSWASDGREWNMKFTTCPVCLSIIRALCDRKLKELEGAD